MLAVRCQQNVNPVALGVADEDSPPGHRRRRERPRVGFERPLLLAGCRRERGHATVLTTGSDEDGVAGYRRCGDRPADSGRPDRATGRPVEGVQRVPAADKDRAGDDGGRGVDRRPGVERPADGAARPFGCDSDTGQSGGRCSEARSRRKHAPPRDTLVAVSHVTNYAAASKTALVVG